MSDVIEIGEYRFKQKRRRFGRDAGCQHKNSTIDAHGDVIRCDDCGQQLGAMWVLREVLHDYGREISKINARAAQLREDTSREIHLIAARRVEKAWRSQSMVPACPHCNRGILPTDGFGSSLVNKKLELRRREVEKTS